VATGAIVGIGHVNGKEGMRPVYLVQLDQEYQFYNPKQDTFVSIIVVARDSGELRPID
jgi:hypothetical protein